MGHGLGGRLVLKQAEQVSAPACFLICPMPPLGDFGPLGRFQRKLLSRQFRELAFSGPNEPDWEEAAEIALNGLDPEGAEWVFKQRARASGGALRKVVFGNPGPRALARPSLGGTDDQVTPRRMAQKHAVHANAAVQCVCWSGAHAAPGSRPCGGRHFAVA